MTTRVIVATAEDGTEYAWGPFYTFNSYHKARRMLLAPATGWTEESLRELVLQKL